MLACPTQITVAVSGFAPDLHCWSFAMSSVVRDRPLRIALLALRPTGRTARQGRRRPAPGAIFFEKTQGHLDDGLKVSTSTMQAFARSASICVFFSESLSFIASATVRRSAVRSAVHAHTARHCTIRSARFAINALRATPLSPAASACERAASVRSTASLAFMSSPQCH